MDDRAELGLFLRAARSRLVPADVGIQPSTRRRVPGLRREECAGLAGISVEYYTRLEQGRASRPSMEVLSAVSRALGLDDAEFDHLVRLAHPVNRHRPPPDRHAPRPELQRLIDAMDGVSATVFDRSLHVIAYNQCAAGLFPGLVEASKTARNSARFVFLSPASRTFLADWHLATRLTVGQLRLAASRWPTDRAITGLIGELTVQSPEFSSLWSRGDITRKTHGRKAFQHPLVGHIDVHFQILDLPGDSGCTIETLIPADDHAHELLTILRSWNTPH